MASTKTLLDTMLESFLTSKKQFIGHQAMPCGENAGVRIEPEKTSTTNMYSVTLAYDGVLFLQGWKASSATNATLYFNTGGGFTSISANYISLCVPVYRGQTKLFQIANIDTTRLYGILVKTTGES